MNTHLKDASLAGNTMLRTTWRSFSILILFLFCPGIHPLLGGLLLKSGFEPGTVITNQTSTSAQIIGTDTSVSSPYSWDTISNCTTIGSSFVIDYQEGDTSGRMASLVADPFNGTNTVLRFWMKEPMIHNSNGVLSKGRIQMDAYSVQDFSQFYYTFRMYMPTQMQYLAETASDSWFTFAEFWNDAWYSEDTPFRLSLGIEINETPLKYSLKVESYDPSTSTFITERYILSDHEVIFGEWASCMIYSQESSAGNSQDGRFYFSIVSDSGAAGLIDYRGHTHHQDDVSPNGITGLSPFKMYCGVWPIYALTNHGYACEIYFDDFAIYEGTPFRSSQVYSKFDSAETDNTIIDSGTLNLIGTNYGAALVEGLSGNCLSFDGVNSNRVDFTTNLASITSGMTISAWLKPLEPPRGSGRVVAGNYHSQAVRGWNFGRSYGADTNFKFLITDGIGGSAYVTVTNFFSLCSNQWVHVSGIFDPGKSIAIYVDGQLAEKKATSITSIGVSTKNLRIGMRADSTVSGQWSGLIENLRIWNSALPETLLPSIVSVPVAHTYSMESASSVYDGGVNKVTGTPDSPSQTIGIKAYALNFDGTSDKISFTNSPVTDGEFSVGCWVKPGAAPDGTGRVIASTYYWSSTASRGWLLGDGSGSTDHLQFMVVGEDGVQYSTSAAGFFSVYSNEWVHLTGVFRPGESISLYIDGEKTTELPTTLTKVVNKSTVPFKIGARADKTTEGFFAGVIDEVQIYNKALSDDEVRRTVQQ